MVCLRTISITGRSGNIQCDEEGCDLLRISTERATHFVKKASQLGITEDALSDDFVLRTFDSESVCDRQPGVFLDRDRYPFAKHFGIEAVGDLGPYPHSCSCHVNGLDCGICNDLGCTYNKPKRVSFTEEELVQFITGHLNISLSTSQRYWVGEYFKENPGITHHDTSDTRGL